jgi:hypothetical protein
MSKRLRAIGVVNSVDLLKRFGGPRDVALLYHATDNSRGGTYAHVSVYSCHHDTQPDAPWYQHKSKWFVGLRSQSMPLAEAWASAKYGIKEWGVDPTSPGSRVPMHIRKAALAALKEAKP